MVLFTQFGTRGIVAKAVAIQIACSVGCGRMLRVVPVADADSCGWSEKSNPGQLRQQIRAVNDRFQGTIKQTIDNYANAVIADSITSRLSGRCFLFDLQNDPSVTAMMTRASQVASQTDRVA